MNLSNKIVEGTFNGQFFRGIVTVTKKNGTHQVNLDPMRKSSVIIPIYVGETMLTAIELNDDQFDSTTNQFVVERSF